jgi:hypothetical protein
MYNGKAGYVFFLTCYTTKNARVNLLIYFVYSYKLLEALIGAESVILEMKIRQHMVEV